MKLIAALPLLALLAGCSSAPSRFYELASEPPTEPPQAVAASRPIDGTPVTVALGAVDLPGALDRLPIVRRRNPNRLDYDENERWAAPLDEMTRRVLADDLAARLPGGMVMIEAGSAAPADLTVTLDLSRFDADDSGRVTLTGRWQALGHRGDGGQNSAALAAGPRQFTIVEPGSGGDAAAIAAAMSRAVADLATQIAANLRMPARLWPQGWNIIRSDRVISASSLPGLIRQSPRRPRDHRVTPGDGDPRIGDPARSDIALISLPEETGCRAELLVFRVR